MAEEGGGDDDKELVLHESSSKYSQSGFVLIRNPGCILLHTAWVHTCKSEPRPLPAWRNGLLGREQLLWWAQISLENGDVSSRLAQSSRSYTLLLSLAAAFVE
jgi:hypothetical protein